MLRRILIAAAASATLMLSSTAFVKADDWKVTGEFGWFGVGKTQEIEKGHFYWVGEFTGAFFNDKGENSLFHRAGVKCPGWLDVDTNNKKSKGGGYCVITDLAGDQAYLTWQCRKPKEQYDMLRLFRAFLQWRQGDCIVLAEANVLPETDMEYL
jgi:hypothetical protein